MRAFFHELKRRRVYRVALAYGIFASAMIQVGGTILPIFHAPEWGQQVFVVLIAIGFPFALVLGWLYDITAEGIQRTPNAKGLRVYSGRQLWLVAVAGLFVIQSDLAQAIVNQLQAKLSPQQKAEIEETPTRDLAAFDLYLQAKEIVDTYTELQDPGSSLLKAVRLLDEATERDPNFVLAYCYTSRAHNLLYFFDLDSTPKRILLGEAAVNNALRLRPNSAEAHLAMADHYFRCHR